MPAIFSFLVYDDARVYSTLWASRRIVVLVRFNFVIMTCSSKTFDLVRRRRSLGLENDAFYTDCFENDTKRVYETFSNLPTAEAKFVYVNGLLESGNKLPVENNMTNVKDDNDASQLRHQANIHFRSQDYVKALRDYNISVMVAVVGSEDYALAVANRSAALFQLEKYDASVGDIRHALANNYPLELAYKLYDREVKCLLKLKKITQANHKYKVSTQ